MIRKKLVAPLSLWSLERLQAYIDEAAPDGLYMFSSYMAPRFLIKVVEERDSRLKVTHYWVHPESDCYFTTTSDEHPGDTCEELTKEEYEHQSAPVTVDVLTVYPNAWGPFLKGSCHLECRNLDKLHAFAESIGLKRSWFQDHPKHPHYDLTPGKRALAVKRGAVEINQWGSR